jgi:hypothetical protein
VRRSKIQTRQSPSVLYCGIFHSQNILCVLVYNIMWSGIQCFQCYNCYTLSVVSKSRIMQIHLVQSETAYYSKSYLKPFQHILQSIATYQLMSQCYRLFPRTVPVPLLCSFVSTYITEIGTGVDWLL